MDRVAGIVIGAGVVGLAIARRLAPRGPVLILEREPAFGTQTSSRNSEVIHAGLYYPPGSLKARLCTAGRDLTYAYAATRGIPHRRCGKLIVATEAAQEATLDALAAQAAANGVRLTRLTAAQARALEPALSCTGALLSPDTGILDSHALMQALLTEAEAAGALLAINTAFTAAHATADGFVVETRDRASGAAFTLRSGWLVNAAGLAASEAARGIDALDPAQVPQTRFARGSYFAVTGRPAFARLIYPVPEPGGLGVHLTLDLAGQARFGPDVEWIDRPDTTVSPARCASFETAIRRYWPALPEGALAPVSAGVRPKLSGPGEPAADFRIDGPAAHGVPGLVCLYGIESPGLTAALAIADHVADCLDGDRQGGDRQEGAQPARA